MKIRTMKMPRGVDCLILEFPGGHVEVARCSDGTHWAHIRRETKATSADVGKFSDSRIDREDQHASETRELGEMISATPEIYHVAVRVEAV